jgi:hypothetical protein
MKQKRSDARQELVREFGLAQFGDERLSARVQTIAGAVVRQPEKSLPQQNGNAAAREATYRFLGSERVTPEQILAPHVAATVARCRERKRVVVAHDTTEFAFAGRDQLGYLSGTMRGFIAHFALAIAFEKNREPLGVLHIEPIVRDGEPKQGKRTKPGDPTNESLRWNRTAAAAHLLLGEIDAIHVYDREADNYSLMVEMVARGQQFVVRASHDRSAEEGMLSELLEGATVQAHRTVMLSKRGQRSSARAAKRHPARSGREAKLQISSRSVTLRANSKTAREMSSTLKLNLVRVFEVDVPEGEPAVEWRLWTALPVANGEDLLTIVDAYRARWVIEEYFKALKTGCAYEQRQLESRHSLLNALAIFAPVAWLLLRLRSLARSAGDEPQHSLSAPQMICLRFILKRLQQFEMPADPTEQQTLSALARLGGHITSNGDPGWLVLGRGLDTVLSAELGYMAANM